jgi:hypothetical protein
VRAAAAGAAVLLVATLLGCPARGSAAAGASVTVDQPGVLGAFMPSTITVSASGLPPGLSYAVGFDEADLTAADIKPDASGAITVSDVLVPGAACGDHTVSIVYYTAIVHIAQVPAAPTPAALQRNIVASTNYRVLCPSIDVDPSLISSTRLPHLFAVDPNGDFDYHNNDLPKTLYLDEVALGTYGYQMPMVITAQPSCGTHTLRLVQPSQFGTLDASTTLTVLCAQASLAPGMIARKLLPHAVSVIAWSFYPNLPVALRLEGNQVATATTDESGALTTPITASGLDCGPHQVTVIDNTTGVGDTDPGAVPGANYTVQQASAPLTVLCAIVHLTPDTFPRASQPRPVSVSGSSFHPNVPVDITLDGKQVATAVTGDSGAVTKAIRASGLGCGDHRVIVSERPDSPTIPVDTFVAPAASDGPLQGAALLHVLCGGGGPARTPHPTLALAPPVISAGMMTHVTGSGYTPKHAVTLTWHLTAGGTAAAFPASVVASASGTIDIYCLVLQHEPSGSRLLVATDGAGTAKADAVVDGGTMQPSGSGPDLVFRR